MKDFDSSAYFVEIEDVFRGEFEGKVYWISDSKEFKMLEEASVWKLLNGSRPCWRVIVGGTSGGR